MFWPRYRALVAAWDRRSSARLGPTQLSAAGTGAAYRRCSARLGPARLAGAAWAMPLARFGSERFTASRCLLLGLGHAAFFSDSAMESERTVASSRRPRCRRLITVPSGTESERAASL